MWAWWLGSLAWPVPTALVAGCGCVVLLGRSWWGIAWSAGQVWVVQVRIPQGICGNGYSGVGNVGSEICDEFLGALLVRWLAIGPNLQQLRAPAYGRGVRIVLVPGSAVFAMTVAHLDSLSSAKRTEIRKHGEQDKHWSSVGKEPLIMVPGLGYGAGLFQHQLEFLREVASPRVLEVTHVPLQPQIDAILGQAGDGDFSILAHSGGTLAAIAVAATVPDRVSHLILQGSMGLELPPIKEYLSAMIADLADGGLSAARDSLRAQALGKGHPAQAELTARVAQVQGEVPQEVLARQCQFIIDNMDQSDALTQISAKTLFVQAREDGFFDEALTLQLVAQVPDASYTVVENSGHLMAMEQPEALTALTRLWLTH